MKKTRKNYTAEEKVAILRRHLLEQEPISKLCEELGLRPTIFYRWQKEFFENGAAAFQGKARANHPVEQERIERLQKKIQIKDEVLAELMAEHVALKKVLRSFDRGLGAARRADQIVAFLSKVKGRLKKAVGGHWLVLDRGQVFLCESGSVFRASYCYSG